MYRLKNDKRVFKSAEQIKTGLMKCILEKTMDSITVSDIAGAANVSRATFYRLFDTPSDVLSYACDQIAKQTSEAFREKGIFTTQAYIKQIMDCWMKESDFIEAIISNKREDILEKAYEKYSEDYLPKVNYDFSEREYAYIHAGLASVLCSILLVWVRNGKTDTQAEINKMFMKFIEVLTDKKFRIQQ